MTRTACDVCGAHDPAQSIELAHQFLAVDGDVLTITITRNGDSAPAVVCDDCHNALKDAMTDREAVADANRDSDEPYTQTEIDESVRVPHGWHGGTTR
jgi:hypothetical protein